MTKFLFACIFLIWPSKYKVHTTFRIKILCPSFLKGLLLDRGMHCFWWWLCSPLYLYAYFISRLARVLVSFIMMSWTSRVFLFFVLWSKPLLSKHILEHDFTTRCIRWSLLAYFRTFIISSINLIPLLTITRLFWGARVKWLLKFFILREVVLNFKVLYFIRLMHIKILLSIISSSSVPFSLRGFMLI